MIRFFTILRRAFALLKRNDPLRLAAATAFFTTFALPAILIILIQVLGLVFSRREISQHILEHLSNILGVGTVNDLHTTLRNVRHLATNWYIATGGFLFLIFVSTTLFTVIKDSLNQLWDIKSTEKHGLIFLLKLRARSFAIILVTGILFLIVFLAEGLQEMLSEYFAEIRGHNFVILQNIVNQVVSLTTVCTWFTVIFRFLPDGHFSWRTVFTGGLFTGILFTGGKLLLGVLLSYSNMQTIYGASTSMVLLLLFVFYSAFIFYYGACFTKVWAEVVGKSVKSGSREDRKSGRNFINPHNSF
jgi:membrane protein